jgi:hypothetical protein
MLRIKNLLAYLLLVSGVSAFVFFELRPSLKTPDIYFDESYIGCDVLRIIHNIHKPRDIHLFGRHLLVNVDDKHGALDCYFMLPFIMIGGPTVAAERSAAVLFGVITVVLTFF